MRNVLLLVLVVCSFAATGRDMMCDKIGYLSTSCMNAEVVPFALKSKEVALKEAESSKTTSNDVYINKTLTINKAKEDGIVVTSWMEDSK